MPGPPTLSILIPTFSRSAMLRAAIESVAGQSGPLPDGFRLLVSDDASTDDTRAVLAGFAARLPYLRVYHQPTNLLPPGAGNWAFLLGQVETDLVFLLSDDDAIAPDFVATVVARFAADPSLDLVTADLTLCDADLEPISPLPLATPEGPMDGPARAVAQLRGHHMVMATVYRTSLLRAAGGFDPRVGGHLDCTAFCRAAIRARRTERIARALLSFRISAGSWSRNLAVGPARAEAARHYRAKLDLLLADARSLAPEAVPAIASAYVGHARAEAAAIEIELATGGLPPREARAALRSLLEVFPEARRDRLVRKVKMLTYTGVGWLRAVRRLTGRPDRYRDTRSLFHPGPGR